MVFVSHIFACLWIYIGLKEYELNQQGWIWENSRPAPDGPDIQLLDYWSLYITSIYWVYTTFSSVGYGDVKGFTNNEYMFQLLVEIFGMGFFGYLTGTLQQIMLNLGQEDPKSIQDESIDYWLMSISRVHQREKLLPSYIFTGVRQFFS